MKALIYGDTFPRLLRDMRNCPGKWASRLVFLLGPWACLWMVEILNENDIFEDLAAWQVLMNLVWYYGLFAVLRLVLGRNRRAAALGTVLAFLFGLVNHYVLRFRGGSCSRQTSPAGARRPMWPRALTTPWTST